MRNSLDEPNQHLTGEARYPRKVFVTGVIWIVFGCLLLLYLAAWLLPRINRAIQQQILGGALVATLPGTLVGACFVYVGSRIIRGRVKDTESIAKVSIALALFIGAPGALTIVLMIITGAGPRSVVAFLIGVLLGPGGLFAAGVLALAGRKEYLAWKRAQESRQAGANAETPETPAGPAA